MKNHVDYLVSELCDEIDRLEKELSYAKGEVKHYRELYGKTLDNSIQRSSAMMSKLLTVMLTPGVAEAFVKHPPESECIQTL